MDFFQTEVEERDVLVLGLKTYAEQEIWILWTDFACVRCVKKYDILTFDKKLSQLLAGV